jgi:hypothetical protein
MAEANDDAATAAKGERMSQPTADTTFADAFQPLCGQWQGAAQVWLGPDSPAVEGVFEAESHLAPGQHAFVLEYRSNVGEDRADGIMLIACDDKTGDHKVTWVDSFHTNNGPMTSTGKPGQATLIDVSTTFAAGNEDWGWRTTLQLVGPDDLDCRMYVSAPDGPEQLGVLIRLQRV